MTCTPTALDGCDVAGRTRHRFRTWRTSRARCCGNGPRPAPAPTSCYASTTRRTTVARCRAWHPRWPQRPTGGTPERAWLNVALSYSGLRALGFASHHWRAFRRSSAKGWRSRGPAGWRCSWRATSCGPTAVWFPSRNGSPGPWGRTPRRRQSTCAGSGLRTGARGGGAPRVGGRRRRGPEPGGAARGGASEASLGGPGDGREPHTPGTGRRLCSRGAAGAGGRRGGR